ncbi:MAG: hypothetical protein LBK56_10770 [Gracilibacteraceae bacterium]|jgi:hypothetical protein|nr:hypothetical protein [Gracilibacteraceae bacterium]
MRYYQLLPDDILACRIPLPEEFMTINPNTLHGETPPPRTLFCRTDRYSLFPDIIAAPILLYTDEAAEIAHQYADWLEHLQFSLYAGEKTYRYYAPLLPYIDCLAPESRVNTSKGRVELAVLRPAPIRNHSLFLIRGPAAPNIIIRLDLAESFCFRRLRGFGLRAATLKED